MQTDWGYVALSLILPLLWGVVSARAFDWIQARRPKPTAAPDQNQSDDREMYYI